MNDPHSDDLIAYLYDEADDSTREAVEDKLARCPDTLAKISEWRSTMELLDTWTVTHRPAPKPGLWVRTTPILQAAAAISILLGAGVWIASSRSHSASASVASQSPSNGAPTVEPSATAVAVTQVAARPAIDHREVEKHILMASGAMTHRQVQAHLQEALHQLRANEVRNEMLVAFLPPAEQESYQKGKLSLKTVAEGVARAGERNREFTQQIIARAKARSATKH